LLRSSPSHLVSYSSTIATIFLGCVVVVVVVVVVANMNSSFEMLKKPDMLCCFPV
jgi:hypothetical protein